MLFYSENEQETSLALLLYEGMSFKDASYINSQKISRGNKNIPLRSTELQQLLCLQQSIWL